MKAIKFAVKLLSRIALIIVGSSVAFLFIAFVAKGFYPYIGGFPSVVVGLALLFLCSAGMVSLFDRHNTR